MNSGNHLMQIGDLITWCHENLAGIRPDDEAGKVAQGSPRLDRGPAAFPTDRRAFKHLIMRPTPVGDLSYVKASYNSPYGKIESGWKISSGHFVWSITTPANSTATIYVPSNDAARVTESGKAAAKARGVTFVRAVDGAAVYEIGSGHYQFESPLPR
jgi:alpha-L-rhamnosidase